MYGDRLISVYNSNMTQVSEIVEYDVQCMYFARSLDIDRNPA